MAARQAFFSGLKCRECGRQYPLEAIYVCDFCFGPLEVDYDYDAIRGAITREAILSRPNSMWRYRELLPVEGEPTVGAHVGFTPLLKADRLAKRLGVRELWLKNDTVNYPTLSFKDRVVSVALTRSIELGFDTVACASTGNLANSVAANAAAAGLKSYVFIPSDLEVGKVLGSLVYGTNVVSVDGTYDKVNRLCSEVADKYNWAFANVNIRPYYAEGSKTMGFEIAEQLGWQLPDNVVVPMAGGSLIVKIEKAFKEFVQLGLVPERDCRIFGAQAENCAPIVTAVKEGTDVIRPVENPNTIVKSLAIGNPADGFYAADTMNRTGGYGEDPTDEETVEGIKILGECEGVFAETAGGVTVAAAKRLIDAGRIDRESSTVLCITGNGLKTREVLEGRYPSHGAIQPTLADLEGLMEKLEVSQPKKEKEAAWA